MKNSKDFGIQFYIDTRIDQEDGLVGFGLHDHLGPFEMKESAPTPLKFSDSLLLVKLCRITALAAKLVGDVKSEQDALTREKRYISAIRKAYLDTATGRCKVEEQTAVAMMIVLGIYDSLQPLKQQLHELVEQRDWHYNCGMLGMQFLYPALDICGLQEDAYRIVTAHGRPSYREWADIGGCGSPPPSFRRFMIVMVPTAQPPEQ